MFWMPMKYTTLGNTGIEVSRICVGCMSYGKASKEFHEWTLGQELYQIHRFDYDTPIEETLEALDSLVKAGKVRATGASAMYGYQFHNMQECADRNGWTKFSTMQNHYNLMYREDEHELIPVCRQYGVSLIPYSPLAGGHLSHRGWESGTARSNTDRTIRSKYDHAKENDLEIIDAVATLAERKGVSMSEISLAWLLARGVAAPIVGALQAKDPKKIMGMP